MDAVGYALAQAIPATRKLGSANYDTATVPGYPGGTLLRKPALARIADDQVLMVASDGSTKTCYLYDHVTKTYTAKAAHPDSAGVLNNANGASHGGNAYVIADSSSQLARWTTANTWTTMTACPETRNSCVWETVGSVIVHAFGGGPSGTCRTFDPVANTWTAKASSTARHSPGFSVASDGATLYVTGGYVSASTGTAVHRFDPVANTWTARTALPVAVQGHVQFTASDGLIYISGGQKDGASAPRSDVYDPAANAWNASAAAGKAGPYTDRYQASTENLKADGSAHLVAGASSPAMTSAILLYEPERTEPTPGRSALLAYLASK